MNDYQNIRFMLLTVIMCYQIKIVFNCKHLPNKILAQIITRNLPKHYIFITLYHFNCENISKINIMITKRPLLMSHTATYSS